MALRKLRALLLHGHRGFAEFPTGTALLRSASGTNPAGIRPAADPDRSGQALEVRGPSGRLFRNITVVMY